MSNDTNKLDVPADSTTLIATEVRKELIDELLAEVRKLTAAIAATQATIGQFASAAQALQGASDALAIATRPERALVDMNDYFKDDVPRAGCTLVIKLTDTRWDLDAYAPGYGPTGHVGLISSYAPRPLGSAGIAIDAVIARGFDWRWALPQMIRAERDYSASLGSGVTV